MEKDREIDVLKLILFMAFMLLIVEMSYILPNLFSGDMRGLVGTLAFFATFILMFIVVERFAAWDGTTLEKLGVEFDDQTVRRIIIGAVAGIAATALISAVAFFFGGQLRPFDEITADLLFSEIIITAP
ncbi:MAG: hypothetical protein IH631_09640, partial [Candidatus Thorarchaeota archaeon]|nr:hypothetical protein [Candidatus Thorarchaeota archaeon]